MLSRLFSTKTRTWINLSLLAILIVGLFFRFYGLFWGGGYFFHPDENNMARAISQLTFSNLDPNFYAYGQFPLYLAYFSGVIFNLIRHGSLAISFSQAVYLLRFWSAVFSFLTILVSVKLSLKFFSKNNRYYFPALLALSPGIVQAAHFGTTESVLTFIFLLSSWLGIKIIEENQTKDWLFLGFATGIGLASKLSAAVFLLPLFIVLIVSSFFKNYKKEKEVLKKSVYLLLVTVFVFALFCPFFLINWPEALSTFLYESRLARGEITAFYTRQFANTRPFLFQFEKILPWSLGPAVFLAFLFGFILSLRKLFLEKNISIEVLVLFSGAISWFIFNAFLYTKWTRFMTPVLPFFIFLAAWFFSQLRPKTLRRLWLVLSFIPGLLFLKVYQSDIRIEAASWMNENIPAQAFVLSEGGNVVNLPMINTGGYEVANFDFYSLEEKPLADKDLAELVSKADYILIPSRRVFANLKQSKSYPRTVSYYNQLFSDQSEFFKYKQFKVFADWQELFLGSDLQTEETWTVFDRPTIRIYKKKG